MTEEKKKILEKIDMLLDKRKEELLSKFPHIHEVYDGILIRFFDNWGECPNSQSIRYKIITNENDENDFSTFQFIPKDTVLEKERRSYLKTITCLSGKIDLLFDDKTIYLEPLKKIELDDNHFGAIAHEDSYVLTSNK